MQKRPYRGAFVVLGFLNVRGVRSFRTVTDIKRNFVAFPKILELDVLKLVAVEKKIFFLTLTANESKSSFVDPSDYTFWHCNGRDYFNKYSNLGC